MSTPFNAVAAAYNNASKLITDAAKTSSGALGQGAQGPDFGKLLSDQVQGATDDAVNEIDAILAAKEQEIMQV